MLSYLDVGAPRGLFLCVLGALLSGAPQVAIAKTLVFSDEHSEVHLTDIKGSTWYANVTEGEPGCGGRIEGQVTFVPKVNRQDSVKAYVGTIRLPNLYYRLDGVVPAETTKDCAVDLRIVGKTITVSEEDGAGCVAYHGVDCDLDSDVLSLN